MRDQAARVLQADDDYEYLRARANAEMHSVPAPGRPQRLRDAAKIDFAFEPEPDPAPEAEPERVRAPAARYEMRRPSRPRAVESAERNRPVSGVEGRRTIEISGQAAPARRHVTPSTTVAARPDRVALWGVLLGVFLILMAVSTAHAAV
jgi:hypothetical protein